MSNLATLKPPWQPGQSGNPAGRPKGARSKLEEAFLADMHKSWQDHGPAVITRVIAKDPVSYLRIAAGLMPRNEDDKDSGNVTRERVQRAIAVIESWIATSGTEGSGPSASEGRPA